MDPFDEIRYLGWNIEEVQNFEYSPSHSSLSDRLKKTLYLTEGRADGNGISLPVAVTAVEVFQGVSGSSVKTISPRHVANLSKRSRVAPCTLLLAMIYARRLEMTNKNYIKNMTSADLLLVSMMVASKFLYDEGEDEEMFSDEWATAANVEVDHVYNLEREFLAAMDWKLFVHSEEFFHFIRLIETTIAMRQGLKRGWFSYSDMEVLMTQPCWQEFGATIIQQTLKVIGICLVVYTVCATTIIWSSMVLLHVQLPSSGCSSLSMTLDSQIKKSTLMHHHPGESSMGAIHTDDALCVPAPLQSQLGQLVEDTPKAFVGNSVDNCLPSGHYQEDDDPYPTIEDITTTLHTKYHLAHKALIVFYQALMTAMNSSTSNTEMECPQTTQCNGCKYLHGVATVLPCHCPYRASARAINSSNSQNTQLPGESLNNSQTVPCHCTCGRQWTLSTGKEWNYTGNEVVTEKHAMLGSVISEWYRVLWFMFSGGGTGHTVLMPDLKHRYVDLEVGFITSSF